MKRDILLKKSMDSLEWPALIAELKAKASSEAGKELSENLLPEISEERVETLQSETAEMADLRQRDEGPVIPPFADMRREILETGKSIILEPLALLEISSIVKISENFRLFFNTAAASQYQLLMELSSRFSDTGELGKEIEATVDEQGNIKENASRELSRLYTEKRSVREAVTAMLEPYLSGEQYQGTLREKYFTIREERYVIPVKSEMQKRVDGIIHDSSKSGVTLFVEPKELIPLNNRLRLTDLKIKKEVRKILGRMSGLISEKADGLILDIEILAYFDLLQAKAELAFSMEAVKPKISKSGRIDIKDGRHPLLVLKSEKAVPNTLSLGDNSQVLVISGPNTGGKTVLLKTVGLLSLMLRTGLHIPASEGSGLPLFKEIYADIGDEQNIPGSLSTFAGHLKNVSAMMDHLTSSSLVLLDEFMSSTDPSEGCALAEAILDDFVFKGSVALVTTHFSTLKFIAAEKAGFLNSSMEIDPETLQPTYRLIQGVPGRSHALDIARSLGMNNNVILKAERSIGDDDRSIEKLVKALAVERKELQDEKEHILRVKRETQLLKEEALRLEDELKQKKLGFKRERADALKKEIGAAKDEILEALKELKSKSSERSAEKAMRKLKEIEKSGSIPPDTTGCAPLFTFRPGDYVYIPALKISGTLLSGPSKKNLQKICAGNAEITLDSASTYGKKTAKPSIARHSKPSFRNTRVNGGSSFKKCSLRGLTQETAMEKLTDFLDRAIQHEAHSVTIVHGHGTGTLKKSVREYLRNSPYSDSFSPGLANEGGDGVTIVKLKS